MSLEQNDYRRAPSHDAKGLFLNIIALNERKASIVLSADVRKEMKTGSAELLEKIINESYKSLKKKSTAMLRNPIDAEDAVQNACMKAWRYQSNLRDTASCRSWLNRILYNECLAISKARSKHVLILSKQQLDQIPNGNASPEDEFEHWFVNTILSTLPDHYRLPLILFYEKEISVNGIAEILNVEPKLIRHRIAYARTLVRKKYLYLTDEKQGIW